MSARSAGWKTRHAGKLTHATRLGAWWHCLRIRVKFRDRVYPYRCQWTDKRTRGPLHWHVGHTPGSAAPVTHVTGARAPLTPRSGRQVIIGFSELQLSTLKTRAAAAQLPWQQYAAEIIHDALARPVPRPANVVDIDDVRRAGENTIERCPVHAVPVGDGRNCIACDGGVF